ncbi:FAD-binding oxidoreductase (plasmid) [Agrobacterium tumefaciens]|uniref:FAD-binding oxidoreductase n=1 Tax=Agrobacterium tumefaciens TaxID=358 RepID=A0AAJ4N9A8_AGRTU|nr:FAD-binding oxidoreductase [Agrobacterium tumefaciens]
MKNTPYWWEDAGDPPSFPTQPLPPRCDVVVIGAGHTGLTAARTLAKRGKHVVVLEKERPGFGASSRNGGMIGGGHRLSVSQLEERFGKDVGRRLLKEAHVDALKFALFTIEEEQIDCAFSRTGRFRGLWLPGEYESSSRELERLQKIVPIEAWMVSRADQQKEVATDIYAGGTVYAEHGALHPAKYVFGLLEAAKRHGAQVHGDTAVLGIERDGQIYRVRTTRGVIEAPSVLAATNGYTTNALPFERRRIIPVPSFMVASEPLGHGVLKGLFPTGRMVAESRERHCYFRPSPDGTRLVFGGRASMFEAPETFAQAELRRLVAEVFPSLSSVTFTHSWRGRTGFTFDFLPNIGRNKQGVWHAMGYSGSGNAMAPYLGHKAALQILGDPEGETAFSQTPFETRFWHRGTPWFLPFADVLFRLRDVRNNARRAK